MDVEFIRHKYEDSHHGVITKAKFRLGVRHIQMVYMFACSLVMGAMRSSNGIAILAIADHTRGNGTDIQIHNWDKKIQGTVLSSFFIGYALIMVPAEIYLKQFGDKFIMTAVLLINGALAAAMPTIVMKGGWIAVCNAEFLMGMTQACHSPINLNLVSKWLPPGERTICGFLIQGAILFGTIIALPISGLLSESRLGWELIFYSQAMMTLSTAAIWVLLTFSTPDKHHAIGDTEKEFISQALSCYRKKNLQKPWRRILQTKQFWAIASAHTSANVLFIFFLVEIPSLLFTMNFPIKTSSTQAALPFVGMWAAYVLTSPTLDFVYRIGNYNYFFDIKYFRKIINSFGSLKIVQERVLKKELYKNINSKKTRLKKMRRIHYLTDDVEICAYYVGTWFLQAQYLGNGSLGIVIGLVILSYLIPSWNHLRIVLLVGTFASLGIQFAGFLENHKDMTQNYSDTLLMMSSVVSSAIAGLVPVVTGVIVNDDGVDLKRWKIVFLSLASFYIICNVIYTSFASSDRQDWDRTAQLKFGYCNALTNFELEEMNRSTDLDRKIEENTSL